ncbi:MAG: pyridoxal-phosphate dependent enzyme, partial [Acidobacteriota bacterium]
FDEYVGEGYGKLNRPAAEAIRLMAVKQGILLDPVYTGKALAGLIDLVKKEYFRTDENVVFLHTGGTPALFPYRGDLLSHLGG